MGQQINVFLNVVEASFGRQIRDVDGWMCLDSLDLDVDGWWLMIEVFCSPFWDVPTMNVLIDASCILQVSGAKIQKPTELLLGYLTRCQWRLIASGRRPVSLPRKPLSPGRVHNSQGVALTVSWTFATDTHHDATVTVALPQAAIADSKKGAASAMTLRNITKHY